MFDGHAPYLTSSDVQYVDTNWDLVSGVTMLSLTPNMGSGVTTSVHLLSLLKRLPDLIYLKLAHATSGLTASQSELIISLPLLQ
jgi:hypothetical protein